MKNCSQETKRTRIFFNVVNILYSQVISVRRRQVKLSLLEFKYDKIKNPRIISDSEIRLSKTTQLVFRSFSIEHHNVCVFVGRFIKVN